MKKNKIKDKTVKTEARKMAKKAQGPAPNTMGKGPIIIAPPPLAFFSSFANEKREGLLRQK